MKTNTIIQGDALEELQRLEDQSINMCMTSPPYWALRDYGVEGQLGLEPIFEQYISNLCDIFDEVKRVLRDDGTLWVNIGDTYFGSGKGAGGDGSNKESFTFTEKEERTCENCKKKFLGWKFQNFCGSACSGVDNTPREKKGKLPDKCLIMIPFRFAIEMVNRGWILRNTIIWHKPNCIPHSVRDRFTVDFEYIFLFSKKKKYYFEQQRDKRKYDYDKTISYNGKNPSYGGKKITKEDRDKIRNRGMKEGLKFDKTYNNPDGRNKRTVWTINPKPFSEAHFAVYPEELCVTPIKAGCPEFVCIKCGNPKELEVDVKYINQSMSSKEKYSPENKMFGTNPTYGRGKAIRKMKGYQPTCDCNVEFTGGIVLDPFFGAGTTGVVALKQSKKFIGIELNKEYIEIANKRLKPHLEQRKLTF